MSLVCIFSPALLQAIFCCRFYVGLFFVVYFVFCGLYRTLLFSSLISFFHPFKVTPSCHRLHSTSPPLHYTVTPSETSPLIKSGLCQPSSHPLAPNLPTTLLHTCHSSTSATDALTWTASSKWALPIEGGIGRGSVFIYQLHFISALFSNSPYLEWVAMHLPSGCFAPWRRKRIKLS